MNIKSKIVSLSTAALLTVSLAGFSVSAAVTPFTDLAGIGAKDKILALQSRGVVKGVADGLFAPTSTITAAEGIQLIVNALNLNIDNIRFFKEPKATDYFTNANNDAWYANALIIASVNGMDLPMDMNPDAPWTREEFTYHLVQAMELKGTLPMTKLVPVAIADESQINASYSGAIQRALHYGITALDTESKFNPTGKLSRAEAAEQIYNAVEYIKSHPAPTVTSEP